MSKSRTGHAIINYATGAEVITDTATHTGQFCFIAFYKNSTINSITSTNVIDNNFASATIDSGASLEGHFTSIKLTNGACIAYKI
jgi:hypothetical protein